MLALLQFLNGFLFQNELNQMRIKAVKSEGNFSISLVSETVSVYPTPDD